MEPCRFNIRLDPPFAAGLRQLARANRRSVNAEINLAVQAWIDRGKIQDCANSKPVAATRKTRG